MALKDLSNVPIYDIPDSIKGKTDINWEKYQQMYRHSVDDPEGFWAEMAQKFLISKPPTLNGSEAASLTFAIIALIATSKPVTATREP